MRIVAAAALAAACLLPAVASAGSDSGDNERAATSSERAQPAKKAVQAPAGRAAQSPAGKASPSPMQETPPPPLGDPYRMAPPSSPSAGPHHAGPDPLDATQR